MLTGQQVLVSLRVCVCVPLEIADTMGGNNGLINRSYSGCQFTEIACAISCQQYNFWNMMNKFLLTFISDE